METGGGLAVGNMAVGDMSADTTEELVGVVVFPFVQTRRTSWSVDVFDVVSSTYESTVLYAIGRFGFADGIGPDTVASNCVPALVGPHAAVGSEVTSAAP